MNKMINLEEYKKQQKVKLSHLKENRKYDYDTLRELFETFSNDPDFLLSLYPDIKNNVQEFWVLEFLLRLEKLITDSKDQNSKKHLFLEIMLERTLISNEILANVQKVKTEFNHVPCGKGFVFITYQFYYSEIILQHFAKIFLDLIVKDIQFEKLLHEKYFSYEEFKQQNPNLKTYITNMISLSDDTLGFYLLQHPNMLESVVASFEKMKKNWHYFLKTERQKIFETIADQLNSYLNLRKEQNPNDIRNLKNVIWYACYDLEILDEIFYYLDPLADLKSVRLLCRKLKETNHFPLSYDYVFLKKFIKQKLEKIPENVGKRTRKKC